MRKRHSWRKVHFICRIIKTTFLGCFNQLLGTDFKEILMFSQVYSFSSGIFIMLGLPPQPIIEGPYFTQFWKYIMLLWLQMMQWLQSCQSRNRSKTLTCHVHFKWFPAMAIFLFQLFSSHEKTPELSVHFQ